VAAYIRSFSVSVCCTVRQWTELKQCVLTTRRCISMDYFNNCNFSKQKLMISLMMA
jgi:hypothetical protein